MRSALTIAGSDSGAGAGIQADLKTFAAHGVYGTTVDYRRHRAEHARRDDVRGDLRRPRDGADRGGDVGSSATHAAKTGMLANAAIVEAVAAAVQDLEIPFLVVDPVMLAKSGDRLLDDEAIGAMRSELLRRAFLVTPNIPEAEILAGMEIRTDEDRREAARRIAAHGGVGGADQGRTPP